MSSRLPHKRLFIADLAHRLEDMERHRVPMHPLLYRVLAKRLRQAAAGFSDGALNARFGRLDGVVCEVLEDRHFNTHGQLLGERAAEARRRADRLFADLGVRVSPAGSPVDVR